MTEVASLKKELLKGLKDSWVGLAVTLIVLGIGVFTTFFGKSKPKGCLDPKKFKEFKLVKRTKLTHNTDRFRFALPTPTSVLGLPVGQHIRCRGKDSEGKQVVRPYTPITLDSDVGYFELVVKMYPKGRMSQHFRQMKEGDFLPVLGPVGRFRYCAGQARAFGMLAGGTGITPMFQVTRAILENPKDKTKIYLIYANHTVDDILLKDDLDNFSHEYPDSFKVYYVVNEVLRCGPPGMNKAMAAYLNELGYTPEMQFEF
uniref:NADH-cytochrome b5 reductase n=2 Tax=Opuntia streptacantha TaxID=393608 RepID=A0A7C9D7G3_OPUST